MLRRLKTTAGWSLPPWMLGYGPVALLLLIGTVGIVLRPSGAHHPGRLAAAVVLSTIALLFRRRAPLVVLGLVLMIAAGADYGPVTTLGALLALLSLAMIVAWPAVALGALATAAVIVLTPALHGHELGGLPAVASRLVAIGLAIALGLWLRTRAEFIEGLRERAERLERERELLAAQAVADERVRIARELHDVVAHNVSLMIVQAQALAATSAADVEQRSALDRIAGIGREALSEMQRMLGVLRVEDIEVPERAPAPGVRDLKALVQRTRDAGLEAKLEIDGEQRELPPGVDLSVYRIAQEALTNVIRHARARRATVTLSYAPHALGLMITDDGAASTPPAVNGSSGNRHGLVGMRERVALFGGELEAGPRADGRGYRVRALLPLQ